MACWSDSLPLSKGIAVTRQLPKAPGKAPTPRVRGQFHTVTYYDRRPSPVTLARRWSAILEVPDHRERTKQRRKEHAEILNLRNDDRRLRRDRRGRPGRC